MTITSCANNTAYEQVGGCSAAWVAIVRGCRCDRSLCCPPSGEESSCPTAYCPLCPVLCTMYCALSAVPDCVLYTMYCALCAARTLSSVRCQPFREHRSLEASVRFLFVLFQMDCPFFKCVSVCVSVSVWLSSCLYALWVCGSVVVRLFGVCLCVPMLMSCIVRCSRSGAERF
jgi:hypothetical protein